MRTPGELETYGRDARYLAVYGAAAADLTLVYGPHQTPEDADRSTEYVTPESVAFIEGYNEGPRGLPYDTALRALNELHLQTGTASADYQGFKGHLLDNILANAAAEADYQPAGQADFVPHWLRTLENLVRKDCLIYQADHSFWRPSSEADMRAQMINQLFARSRPLINSVILPKIEADAPLAPALKQLEASWLGDKEAQQLREISGVGKSLLQLGELAVSGQNVPRSENGKIPAYTLYGSAHARSMTARYQRFTEPAVIETESLAEMFYIDGQDAEANKPRRLAHGALATLWQDFMGWPLTLPIIEQAYLDLKYMNTAPPEELSKFLITCANIKREENRDMQQASDWFVSMIREFIPPPFEGFGRSNVTVL